MPSPIAHLTAGYVIYRILRAKPKALPAFCSCRQARWILLLTCLFFSMIPDSDSIMGMLLKNFGAFHNQWSHSLCFAIAPAIAVMLFARLFVSGRMALRWGVLCLFCCATHVILDYFCYGRGVKLFWPVTDQRFIPPVILFYGVHWSDGLFSEHHIDTIINEVLFALVILSPCIYFTKIRHSSDCNAPTF